MIINKQYIRFLQGITVFGCLVPASIQAQVIPDNTLPENSVVTPDGNIIQIDGGTTRGNNLFHSFSEFSVPTGNEAVFNNAEAIDNILSRVTGGVESIIDGGIGAEGTANVFFINPEGIIFGENAFLNVGGSFIGSTADNLLFPDGIEYSATDLDTQPILTINAPIGLSFREEPQPITNLSIFDIDNLVGLSVPANRTLALIGGDVALEGGILSTDGGRIEIGSVAGNSTVSLTPVEQGWDVGYEGVELFQDINLTLAAFVESRGADTGDIEVQGRNISLIEGSEIAINTFEGSAGNLIVTASDSLSISGNAAEVGFGNFESSIFNNVSNTGTSEGSILAVTTDRLFLNNGGQITARNSGDGQGVDVQVNAAEISIAEPFIFDADNIIGSGIFAQVDSGAMGNGGNISIETNKLTINEGGQINTETSGSGNGGELLVNAAELIELTGTVPVDAITQVTPSGLFTDVANEVGATGDGGNLIVNTSRLTVTDGAQISTAARNEGSGGSLIINASESILLSGFSPIAEFRGDGISGIFVSAEPSFEDGSGSIIPTTGNGGTLNLTTGELLIEQGASISADTFSLGNSGNANLNVRELIVRDGGEVRAGSLIGVDPLDTDRGTGGTLNINATESVEVSGNVDLNDVPVNSSILTRAESNGDAGNLTLTTNSLSLSEGGQIDASSLDEANAGDLSIEATNIEILDTIDDNFTTGILAEVEEAATGTGGDIAITSEQLTVNGSQSSISVGNRGIGNAGNLTINSDRLAVNNGAQVSASTFGEGNAGNLIVNATESVELSGNDNSITGLFAQVNPGATGTGGNLDLTTADLNISNGGRVQVSTFGEGDGGELTVSATDINIFRTINSGATGIFAEVDGDATGNGGNVEIEASSLSVDDNTGISVGTFGVGNAGNLTINSDRLAVNNGSQISASTFGEGNAGNLIVNATESVELSGNDNSITGLFAQVNPGATGTGGNLDLTTADLNISNGGRVQVSTFGTGDAGELSVTATDINIFRTIENTGDTGFFAQVATSATGNGGDVDINTNNLSVNDGTQVSVSTFGAGDAGELAITADNLVEVRGASLDGQNPSQISVDAAPDSTGIGGNLLIAAQQLEISDGGRVSAATAAGMGGNITLQIDDTINLDNNSLISAAAIGEANGGNITIDTDFIIARPDGNNDIVASAGALGTGGNIRIDAESVLGIEVRPQSDRTNDIDASGGVDGQVTVNTPDTDLTQGLVEISQNVVEADQAVAQVCRNDTPSNGENSFVVRGKGGIPLQPTAPLNSETLLGGIGNASTQPLIEPIETGMGKIVLARGAIKTESGIVLTAYPTNNLDSRDEGQVNCTGS